MIIDTSFAVYWNAQPRLRCRGLVYVASYPEFRGNGSIRKLMTDILEDNYEAGTALSYFWPPFSYQFLWSIGYHYVFDQKAYTDTCTKSFPKVKKQLGKCSAPYCK